MARHGYVKSHSALFSPLDAMAPSSPSITLMAIGEANRVIALGAFELHKNVALLFAAFAIGQGSLFFAQSWLVLHGQLALVGLFGAAFTFAVLAYYVVDWGGMILLARHELGAPSPHERAQFFWSLVATRAVVATIGLIGIAAWVSIAGEGFTTSYAIAAAPALLLGTMNMGGVLDGLHRSGETGMTTMLPYLLSAAGLPLVFPFSDTMKGVLLGGAFTVGTFLSLLAQYLLLWKRKRTFPFTQPSRVSTFAAAKEGGAILLTLLPNYSIYRIQVALSTWLLGPVGTGLFVYAKQIVNAVMQSIYFIRRAEFPRLVIAVAGETSVGTIARLQTAGIGAGILAASSMVAGGTAAWWFLEGDLATAGLLVAAFGPAVIVAALYAAFNQAYLARKRSSTAAWVGNLGALAGLALAALCILWVGPPGFAIAELMMNLFTLSVLLLLWTPEERSVT